MLFRVKDQIIKQPTVAFIKKKDCFAKFDIWCTYLKLPVTCHQTFLWEYAKYAKPIFHFTKHHNWVKSTETVFRGCYKKCVIFYNFAKYSGKHLSWSLILTKTIAVKMIPANGWFWFLEIYFYNSHKNKLFSRKKTRLTP